MNINPALIATKLTPSQLSPILQGLDWSKVGQHGCDFNYDDSIQGSSTYAIRATMQRAVESRPVATEELVAPDGTKRTFSILCVNYATSWYMSPNRGPRYVIAPQDAGWVIKAVAPFMRPGMKPVFARGSRSLQIKDHWVTAPAWATWIQTRWVCPNCIPQMSNDYEGSVRQWNNNACAPECDVSQAPNNAWSSRFGYDIRIMMPWVRDLLSESGNQVCNPLTDQPGTGLNEAPICLPIPIADVRECRTPLADTPRKYWEDFWAEVGKAITLYNLSSRAAAKEAELEDRPPPPVPPPPPPPAPAVARSRSLEPSSSSSSKLPLVIAGAAVLAAATILWRRRSA